MDEVTTEQFLQSYRAAKQLLGRPDGLREAARLVGSAWPDDDAHPMLRQAHDIALEIGQDCSDCRFYDDDDEAWRHCQDLIEAYIRGDWEDSVSGILPIYGKFDGDTDLHHGFSVTITRRNGRTEIRTGVDELATAVRDAIRPINENQTDQWYLRNVEHLLPRRVGEYRLRTDKPY